MQRPQPGDYFVVGATKPRQSDGHQLAQFTSTQELREMLSRWYTESTADVPRQWPLPTVKMIPVGTPVYMILRDVDPKTGLDIPNQFIIGSVRYLTCELSAPYDVTVFQMTNTDPQVCDEQIQNKDCKRKTAHWTIVKAHV